MSQSNRSNPSNLSNPSNPSNPSIPFLWTPVIAYMAFIFALSSISRTPSLLNNADKDAHALLYAGLGALLVRAIAGGWGRRVTVAAALVAVVIATAYGVSDEFHQSFVPMRQVEAMDVVADATGAALAAFGWYGWDIIRSRHGL